jgi:hypothetical protein
MRKPLQVILACVLALAFPFFLLVIWDLVIIVVHNLFGFQLPMLLEVLPIGNVATRYLSGESMALSEVARSLLAVLLTTVIKTPIKLTRIINFKEPRILNYGLADSFLSIFIAAIVMALTWPIVGVFKNESVSLLASTACLFGVIMLGRTFIKKNVAVLFGFILSFAKLLLAIFAATVAMYNGVVGAITAVLCIIACGFIVLVEYGEKGYAK